MREYIIHDALGKIIVTLPDKCCAFCSHCTDIFYDYSNGPYLFICDKDNKPSAWDTCADYDDIEGDNNEN